MSAETISRVVIFPRGQLSEFDKARFMEAGILVAEADDPTAVVQLNMRAPLVLESSAVSGDAIVAAALRALAEVPPGDTTEMNRAAHRFLRHLADAVAPKAGSAA